MRDFHFEDFTEGGYCAALALAADYWTFASFGTEPAGPHLLWRHDIDVSPNRALRLAQLEHERGLKATYFFLLHSEFYNCMERGCRDIIRQVSAYGHDIGLHFEVNFYPEVVDLALLEDRVATEARLIADLANQEPVAVSFHNPTPEQLSQYDQPRLAGLVNTYGAPLGTGYKYVSDSNGYWRFSRLHDVLAERAAPSLHVLTHPEWWTPAQSSPRDRIVRAVEGRASRGLKAYDAFLAAQGRENVR
jgi:hypothetical protein